MLNLPNIMTLSRFPLLFVIAVLAAYCGEYQTAGIAWGVFTFAAISDFLDGYLARRMKITSSFGTLMDSVTDKIFNVGLMIAFLIVPAGAPLLPREYVWLVIVMLAREQIVTGLRQAAVANGVVLAAERSGKIKTIVQLLAVGGLLLAKAIADEWGFPTFGDYTRTAALALFWVAALLTVGSGIGYLVKYWRLFVGEPTSVKR